MTAPWNHGNWICTRPLAEGCGHMSSAFLRMLSGQPGSPELCPDSDHFLLTKEQEHSSGLA